MRSSASCQEGGRMRIASGWLAWALTALGLVSLWGPRAITAQTSTPAAPAAYLAEVDGIIHPVATEYLRAAIAAADAAGAAVLVITLRTPGGLVDATRDINTAIIGARTPVAVF